MGDPLGQAFGGIGLDPIPLVDQQSQVRVMQERAIAAYRRNLALPDVYIADRQAEQRAVKTVGEDGQELTPERRAELMRQAGVKPMFDSEGQETQQTYVEGEQSAFDQVIESERLGQTAEANRDPIRLVRPRELEDLMVGEITDETVASATGETYIPGTEVRMNPPDDQSCVYTSGCPDHGDPIRLCEEVSAALKALRDQQVVVTVCEASSTAFRALRWAYAVPSGSESYVESFLGMALRPRPDLDNQVRFLADPYGPHAGKYATVFICRRLMRAAESQPVDPSADTQELPVIDDPEQGETDE